MRTFYIKLFLILFLIPTFGHSQIRIPIKKKSEDRVNEEIDDTIDEGLDGIFGKKKKKKKEEEQSNVEETPVEEEDAAIASENSSDEVLKPWSKYDFVPGDIVIFEDNLEGEQNGEFPSKWDLIDGYAENAKLGNENVIKFSIDNSGSTITPLMKKEGDYLPEKFTIEFDIYVSYRTSKYRVYLWDRRQSFHKPDDLGNIGLIEAGYEQGASYDGGRMSMNLPKESQKEYPHWRHVAISFNIRALKVYLDQDRLVMVPNVQGNPTGMSIWASTYDFSQTGNYPTLIKNIRIAEGAVPLYDRFKTEGKIVTNGIKFDSGKATLKPESMGVINEIAKMMQQYPDIKLSVEGHTDSDGETEFNKKLSEERAITVMNKLIEMGISDDRLASKGMGEDVPVADNTSPEGKANNRRVEFVKM
jgi:outer membrane protein OmpA-like peptidoglycan-associated protein